MGGAIPLPPLPGHESCYRKNFTFFYFLPGHVTVTWPADTVNMWSSAALFKMRVFNLILNQTSVPSMDILQFVFKLYITFDVLMFLQLQRARHIKLGCDSLTHTKVYEISVFCNDHKHLLYPIR
jgi:hypothetical protein